MTSLVVHGLLLDMDGVLVDSQATVEAAWTAWAQRAGIEREQVLAIAHGMPSRDVLKRFGVPAEDLEAETRWVESQSDESAVELALPGAARILAETRVPLAVVTSAGRALAAVRLAGVGLSVPELMVTSDDVEHGKPDPEPYARGAALLGLEPAACLAFDDAPPGVVSARGAGAYTVGVTTSHTADQLHAADLTIPTLDAVAIADAESGVCVTLG